MTPNRDDYPETLRHLIEMLDEFADYEGQPADDNARQLVDDIHDELEQMKRLRAREEREAEWLPELTVQDVRIVAGELKAMGETKASRGTLLWIQMQDKHRE